MASLLSWERGLKSGRSKDRFEETRVAPLVGAWIEIYPGVFLISKPWSLLSWERGLKYQEGVGVPGRSVAPLVGAWIEMSDLIITFAGISVAPLVGAWIEIEEFGCPQPRLPSLLSWERGLKS